MLRRLSRFFLIAVMALCSRDVTGAAFPWKSTFTSSSSPDLARLHEALLADGSASLRACPVESRTLVHDDFELNLESGILHLEPPVEGVTVGGFFEGKATISYKPNNQTARTGLRMALSRETLERVPVATVYLFSLEADSMLASLSATEGACKGGSPVSRSDVYASDKSAMRQLGMDLTEAFLNRRGPAARSLWILFPMEEIRGPRSEEARLLYSFNPLVEQSVSLDVFGHDELVAMKPYKFRFYSLARSASRSTGPGVADIERYAVRISLGRGPESAEQEATLTLRAAPGLSALRLNYTIMMVVSSIMAQDRSPLPFLQWEALRNDPNFDETVLVRLPEVAPEAAELKLDFKATGLLFEPWGSSFVLMDEDNWYPRLPLNDDAHHELELTIPKRHTGIGVGEKIREDAASGVQKTVAFRTTQPVDQSTFYYGDYTSTMGKADEIEVELYQHRTDVNEQQNARFTMTEITNALKVFNRMFVPLEIKHLRVASTRTSHGRGFEGLLLMGGYGTSNSSDSVGDLFRAHEVAHQWWGNYVRPKRWPQDRWLSEAFAEYSAMEYYKIRFEDPKKAITLMSSEWVEPLTEGTITVKSLSGEKERSTGGTIYPLAAGTNNVYTKGPMVLNMLRYLIKVKKGNDESFFALLKDFLQTYKYKSASSADFRRVAERHAGVDLGWFFDQWVEDGGLPIIRWTHEVVPEGGSWLIKLRAIQEQKHYKLLVPIYVRFDGDKMAVTPWFIEGPDVSRTVKVPMKPRSVSLNDGLESLLILKGM